MAGFSEIAELVALSAAGANKKLPLAFWIEIWNSSVNSHRLKARWAASVLSFLDKLTNASMENREEFKFSLQGVCRGGSPCFHNSKCVRTGRRRRTTMPPIASSRRLPSSNLKFHRSLGTMNSARCQAKLKRAHAYICICAQLGAWLGTLSWLKVVFFRFVHINIQLQTYQWSGFQAKHILLWEILNA